MRTNQCVPIASVQDQIFPQVLSRHAIVDRLKDRIASKKYMYLYT